MKYLNLLMIALLVTSCCSTQKATETPSKQIAQAETIKMSDTPIQQNKTPEVAPPKEDNSKIIIETKKVEQKMPGLKTEIKTKDRDTNNSSALKHSRFDFLLGEFVSEDGQVDYKGFKDNRSALKDYLNHLSENLPSDLWSKEEKLAYWINAYNAMTIDLIVRNYPVKSIKDIDKPWEQRLWKLGEKWYNLDEIEHQIIRKMNEPRIHFALVCAAKSCPKLYNRAFTAENLDRDLSTLTHEFLTDPSKNNISENNIKLSKIFKWFAKDFKQNGSLIDFLRAFTDINISEKAKKSFKDYNWELND